MSQTFLIWVVTALYSVQAVIAVYGGNHAQALMLAGYTIANVGLIWSFR